MNQLRRNEFIDLMESNELLYEESDYYIKADIPKLGNITYYPKKNKLQINKGNVWKDDGFCFIKKHLESLK